jgi:hypothetical protein
MDLDYCKPKNFHVYFNILHLQWNFPSRHICQDVTSLLLRTPNLVISIQFDLCNLVFSLGTQGASDKQPEHHL